jgi:Glyoxalase-like domain
VNAVLDHLVVAARSLDEGVRWCEATLGVTPGPGGKHALMGTHNRLFSVAGLEFANAYFEIVAIDQQALAPQRRRWFGLDAIDLSSGPRLIHWVARTPGIDAQLEGLRAAGVDAGRAVTASRETPQGLLSWRISVREDGALLFGGALPTLIEWGERHPAASMPASGVTLRSMVLRGVPHAAIAALRLQGIQISNDAGPALTVELNTPRGQCKLST